MADLKIKYKDLETAIKLSKEINQELTNSYQTVTRLKLIPICQVVRKN